MNPPRIESWMYEAACHGLDVDIFFSDRGEYPELAKQVCSTCPVRVECCDYAIAHGIQAGVWGGLCYRDRNKIRRARNAAARAMAS